ncbi:hypothetical protein [Pedobacter sp. L105]|uniref:hypothetical protein n=1 Tax=Pedobacter sp. L105 TaxID=1641871 RepID=UPI00131D8C20|nr:hypothetical protein [Pedobacter sp. L105]
MNSLKLLSFAGLFILQWPNYTKHWDSHETNGHNDAKFEEFNGKQKYEVKLPANGDFSFKYTSVTKKGKLHLVVKSSSKMVLDKDLIGSDSGELKIENPKGEKYNYIFTAVHAEGSFEVNYKAL